MIEVRSYRRVFDLERRIYRIDHLRLNPGGVPVRGIVYFLVLLLSSVVAGRVPLLGAIVKAPPWYLRNLALPAGSATVLGAIRIEGRPFHLAAQSLARYALQARVSVGGSGKVTTDGLWHPDEILLLPDGSDGEMRRMLYTGPGALLVAVEHERDGRAIEQGATGMARRGRRPELVLRQLRCARAPQRAQVISLGAGVRCLCEPGQSRR